MYVIVTKVKKRSKVYKYAKLIENFRRPEDGRPTHRTIANLGALSDIEIENFKAAIAASRKGKKVVVAKLEKAPEKSALKPQANLRFLDIAVLLELWRRWGLDELFDDLLPMGDAAVTPSSVVAALTIERCVDPGSKLYAERWFPNTALPELLGISPESFNNTRIHRVLDGLDQVGYELQGKVPRLYAKKDGAFAALFVDVTDTWFAGHGPAMAERSKTKEGVVRRKVGIVLLCNEHGYPLRWEVIRGKESDKVSMTRMVESISGLSWVGETPVVCDRAMGNSAQIRSLVEAKVHFLTALVSGEIGAYTDAIPHKVFANFVVTEKGNAKQLERQVRRAGKLAEAAGMEKVEDRLYVLDLGLVERTSDDTVRTVEGNSDNTIEAMRLAREMRRAVAEGRASSRAAAGRSLGLGKGLTIKYGGLTNLGEDIQLAVLEGKARGVSIVQLLRLGKKGDLDAQQGAFERLVQKSSSRRSGSRKPSPRRGKRARNEPLRVRAVAYFNPEMFVDQRLRAERHLEENDEFVATLNDRLASSRSKLTKSKVLAEVHQKLRTHNLIDAYRIRFTGEKRVELELDADRWARRRCYDGFSLLVAHPDEKRSGVELCKLYRAKDKVEKDFETIKSFIKLRPIRHRLDAKVRAHVTICMLALLLERTLERSLGNMSHQAAIEELRMCHLNLYPSSSPATSGAYAVTELTKLQDSLLRKLKMRYLGDEEELMDRLAQRNQSL